MEKPFFMVFVEGGNSPTFKHQFRENAATEAKRLTQLTSKKTYVLKTVEAYEEAPKVLKIEIMEEDCPHF